MNDSFFLREISLSLSILLVRSVNERERRKRQQLAAVRDLSPQAHSACFENLISL
jgi:hypothetical protein